MSWASFTESVKSNATAGWTSYILITVCILIIWAIVGVTAEFAIKYRAENLTKTHVLDEGRQAECSVAGSPDRVNRINAQLKEVSVLGNSHRGSAISFYTYFYTSYLVFTIFGIIAGISLALIAKKGIDNNASPHLITVFLVCTGIAVLYQGGFDVFQQKTNIDNNEKLAVDYANLADQLETYCVTGKINVADPNTAFAAALPKPSAKPANTNSNSNGKGNGPREQEKPTEIKIQPYYVEPTGDQFITYIAWQMEHLRSFSISVDATKVTAIDNKRFAFQ